MAMFILVHGSWHGGWCWERLVPLLEARGHRVLAPDLPGMGADATPPSLVTLDLWAQAIAHLAGAQDEPVVLVGHSRGGIVISQAAEIAPETIAGLVYLTAFLVPDGRSLVDVSNAAPSAELAAATLFSVDGVCVTLAEEAVGPVFYQTTAPEWLARTGGRFTPEPIAPALTPLSLSHERWGSLPRAYIEAALDRAITLQLQRAMQQALPCDPVFTLPTDHSPFYSAPEALAEALEACAEAFALQRAAPRRG